jgi:hypothetical protein
LAFRARRFARRLGFAFPFRFALALVLRLAPAFFLARRFGLAAALVLRFGLALALRFPLAFALAFIALIQEPPFLAAPASYVAGLDSEG